MSKTSSLVETSIETNVTQSYNIKLVEELESLQKEMEERFLEQKGEDVDNTGRFLSRPQKIELPKYHEQEKVPDIVSYLIHHFLVSNIPITREGSYEREKMDALVIPISYLADTSGITRNYLEALVKREIFDRQDKRGLIQEELVAFEEYKSKLGQILGKYKLPIPQFDPSESSINRLYDNIEILKWIVE